MNRLGVLAPHLAGSVHRFDRPVGLRLGDHGMRHQRDVVGQRHVGEGGGQFAALHVAEQMKFDGSADRLGHGSHGARQFAKVAVAVAGRDGLHRGAQCGLVLNRLGHEPQLRAKCRHLGARGAFSGQHAHGGVLGIGQASSGTHAEGVVDHQQHQPIARERGRVAVDEGIGEGENQEHQQRQPQREQQVDSPAGDDGWRLVCATPRTSATAPAWADSFAASTDAGRAEARAREAGQEPGREESHLVGHLGALESPFICWGFSAGWVLGVGSVVVWLWVWSGVWGL